MICAALHPWIFNSCSFRNDLFVTAGATLGLVVIIRHFLNPDQTIFVENPTYPVFAQKVVPDNLVIFFAFIALR